VNIRRGRPSILLDVSVRSHPTPGSSITAEQVSLPTIAISMGDPGGIGPEIVYKALCDNTLRESARWILVGVRDAIALTQGSEFQFVTVRDEAATFGADRPETLGGRGSVTLLNQLDLPAFGSQCPWPPEANAAAGEASFRFVERAIELAKLDASSPWHADAVVTAPINKESWSLAGHGAYPGHTELFAQRFAASRFAMMFHAPACDPDAVRPDRLAAGLNVILATIHCPLKDVPSRLTMQKVLDAIELGAAAMERIGGSALLRAPTVREGAGLGGAREHNPELPSLRSGLVKPRIGVCGLNPHAGEHGLLGHEDDSIIAPAVRHARERGIDAVGPLPADTIFQGALAFPGQRPSRFDLVVAMYHDQGLIPLKTIAWDRAVNMTLGLPIVRTSPDHGTAFDIAGKGIADAGSMKAAMRLAVAMVGS
jgi:4-hydroxythreonine-4-phosphate dehydrogenase